jgi:hypothetical protein
MSFFRPWDDKPAGERAVKWYTVTDICRVVLVLVGPKHLRTTQQYIYVNDEMKRAVIAVA